MCEHDGHPAHSIPLPPGLADEKGLLGVMTGFNPGPASNTGAGGSVPRGVFVFQVSAADGPGWICSYAATCASRIPRLALQRKRTRYVVVSVVRELRKATSSWMRDGVLA